MRIGIDATCWANSRGYGRFTREIVPVMAALAPDDRFICFVDQRADEHFDLDLPNVERRVVRLDHSPTTAASADGNRSPLDMLRLTWAVTCARLDVFFSPSVYTYFPLPPGLRAVVTVHDAIAERFPELTLPGRRARVFWRLKVLLALWQARLVLTVSDFAAREIARELRIKPERIRVALEAPAPVYMTPALPGAVDRARLKLGLPADGRWLVYVGGFNPHKNIDFLVRAHAAVVRERPAGAPHLVLVGPTGSDVFHSDQARIRRIIDEEGTGDLVHWLGFLPDDELRHIHAGALALVLPSTCEGFGLPAVEAAACATPVIATTESPLPELLAGGGLFVVPQDLNALIGAMRRMMRDEPERQAMGRRAREHALELTWERGARAALKALNEVA
jgi:glycosyltransferase involved in cell wall biosynthesis